MCPHAVQAELATGCMGPLRSPAEEMTSDFVADDQR